MQNTERMETCTDRLRGGVRTVDGCRLVHVAEGTGPPILFVHGGLGRGSGWIGVADRLRASFTCHLLDQRAHGASDWGGGPDVGRAAADVLDAIAALGPVHAVVGHSYGALVALEAARLGGPAAVPRLVVYEPPLTVTGPLLDDDAVARVEAAVAAGDFEGALLLFMGAEGSGVSGPEATAIRTNPMLRASWVDLVVQAPSIAPGVRAANAMGSAEPYRGLAMPTRILVGGDSPRHPFQAAADALVGAMADAHVTTLAGQRHLAVLTAPDLVAAAIEEFVS